MTLLKGFHVAYTVKRQLSKNSMQYQHYDMTWNDKTGKRVGCVCSASNQLKEKEEVRRFKHSLPVKVKSDVHDGYKRPSCYLYTRRNDQQD
ncbi:hypothetical protein TNCV_4700571 [Trichonephila clavipes]|nr:hypothetical protein TNCV_4700571 [Trichonephila clavipes]